MRLERRLCGALPSVDWLGVAISSLACGEECYCLYYTPTPRNKPCTAAFYMAVFLQSVLFSFLAKHKMEPVPAEKRWKSGINQRLGKKKTSYSTLGFLPIFGWEFMCNSLVVSQLQHPSNYSQQPSGGVIHALCP
ncbi:hypothetical protein GDO78_004959 [Eleutherodactylus coqui]|uniref:Uncharacterized protein n=1 Tax=Eleutherodactylus coqui TaxID=57060 RepID=A0A8J6FIV1_ELECQ|nr:hypothetical protein GDO78_004959 [Eleutherodactylus coqui]